MLFYLLWGWEGIAQSDVERHTCKNNKNNHDDNDAMISPVPKMKYHHSVMAQECSEVCLIVNKM